ncbi:MAG: hypothetical protein ACRD1Q_14450 [Vicinamibacterales bacterium]
MINVPFERPAQFGERRFLTDEEFASRVQENDKLIADANGERPVIPFAEDPAANNAPRHWLERGQNPSRQRTVALDLATTPNYQIYEYACHEGNYGLANILSAARAEER